MSSIVVPLKAESSSVVSPALKRLRTRVNVGPGPAAPDLVDILFDWFLMCAEYCLASADCIDNL